MTDASISQPSRVAESPSRDRSARTAADDGAGEGAEAAAKRASRDLSPIIKLRPFVLRYRRQVGFALVALLLSATATLTMPIAVRHMIDIGFSTENIGQVNTTFAFLGALGLLLAGASATRYYFVNWLGERIVADLRDAVFRHLTTLSPAFYETAHSGELMSRLSADTTQIKTAVSTAASQALRNLVVLIGAVLMMVLTSSALSVMVLLSIPIIVLPLMGYGRMVRKLSRRAQDSLADASAYAAENLSHVRTLQSSTHEPVVTARFSASTERAFDAARTRMQARAGLTALAIGLVFASVVGILWYGAHRVIAGELSAGLLGQFVLYSVLAAGAMAELAEVWGEVQQTAGAADRLTEILAVEPIIRSPAVPVPLPQPAQGAVTFEAVTFRYPSRPDLAALDGVSFRVAPGERVALVGPSGAGKSTVFGLILRFYDPTAGRVMMDGVALDRADLIALRQRIALVPQDVALFADTIHDNIAYGAPGATREQVRAAAKTANAHGFIAALPDGYDTRLGEGGVTLSGGQRQRVAIARAVLRDAPLLLLDEATSALDAESEGAVQAALEQVMAGRTSIVIAHRLATVLKADRILVFDSGRIVEEGTHASLVAAGGLYARLARLQFGLEG